MNDRLLMNHCCGRRRQAGFSLVELLVTMVLVGLLTTAMFTIYLNMQQTTYNQEDIIDTQQSLRVAMDSLSHDIRMAGFVVPAATRGINEASTTTALVINTASGNYAFARLLGERVVAGGAGTATFTVAQDVMMDRFLELMKDTNPGTITVRIIRPQDGGQPFDADLTVPKLAGQAAREAARTARSLTLAGFINANPISYVSGDLITLVTDGGADPEMITWDLNAGSLQRTVNGAAPQIIAANVNALEFAYLDNEGNALTDFPLSDADRESIAAVRITVTATAANQLDQADRQRRITSVVRIMNR